MENAKKIIGSAEIVRFPELSDKKVHARIDSGARTSAIWGKAFVNEEGQLEVSFFGDTTTKATFSHFERQVVATSTGHIDKRFKIKLLVALKGKKIRASFTIANRSTQVYPVLIGRNVLRGKFLVDAKIGKTLRKSERKRIEGLQKLLEGDDV